MMMTALALHMLVAAAPEPAVLRFTVEVESNQGQVLCAVFGEEDTWLTKQVVTGTAVKVRGRRGVCVFRDLPPGNYAISAFHDEDGDGELDTNFLGIPSEDYCASRNARGSMGPPSFADAVFRYVGGVQELSAEAD